MNDEKNHTKETVKDHSRKKDGFTVICKTLLLIFNYLQSGL